MRGQPIRIAGPRDADALRALDERLSVIGSRRIPALETFLLTWLGVVLLAGTLARPRAACASACASAGSR